MGSAAVFANLCVVDFSSLFREFLGTLAFWVLPVWTTIDGCGSRSLPSALPVQRFAL